MEVGETRTSMRDGTENISARGDPNVQNGLHVLCNLSFVSVHAFFRSKL